jgi:hypothetical protein
MGKIIFYHGGHGEHGEKGFEDSRVPRTRQLDLRQGFK